MDLSTLQQYEKDGWLYSQTHPKLPLTIWNYSDKTQWEGFWNDITLSCRGLVTDDLGNVVARPFRKFFNLSEGKTNITEDFEIYTKYDGSLGILFWYETLWVFASRGSFTSEQALKGREMLNKTCQFELLDKANTYCFECIYIENRIVVDYKGFEGCILTGVFNTQTGEEEGLNHWLLPHAKSHKLNTPLNEIQKIIKDSEEGYVIKFDNGERCKIKGAEYLRLHKIMSKMSTTAVWECLRNGVNILENLKDVPDEFYKVIKDYEKFLKGEFDYVREYILIAYQRFSKIDDKKEFALAVENHTYKHYFFSLKNGKNIDDQIWRNLKPEYRRL